MDAESPYFARADDGLIPSAAARPRIAMDEDEVDAKKFLRSVLVSKLRFSVIANMPLGLACEEIPKASVSLGAKRKLSRRLIFKIRAMLFYFMWMCSKCVGCCFSWTS